MLAFQLYKIDIGYGGKSRGEGRYWLENSPKMKKTQAQASQKPQLITVMEKEDLEYCVLWTEIINFPQIIKTEKENGDMEVNSW